MKVISYKNLFGINEWVTAFDEDYTIIIDDVKYMLLDRVIQVGYRYNMSDIEDIEL